jgi:hypothetical protein
MKEKKLREADRIQLAPGTHMLPRPTTVLGVGAPGPSLVPRASSDEPNPCKVFAGARNSFLMDSHNQLDN